MFGNKDKGGGQNRGGQNKGGPAKPGADVPLGRAPQPVPQALQPPPHAVRAFAPGEEPPAVLGLAAVTLLDVCIGQMPDIARVERAIVEAGFKPEPEATARGIARGLALESKMVSAPLRDFRHKAWRTERQGVPAAMLLSAAQSDLGPVVFCSALFGGATEAEAVKTVQALSRSPPTDGGMAHDADGKVVRRVFWNLQGQAGLLGLVVCGPENPETRDHLRALVAFNRAV